MNFNALNQFFGNGFLSGKTKKIVSIQFETIPLRTASFSFSVGF